MRAVLTLTGTIGLLVCRCYVYSSLRAYSGHNAFKCKIRGGQYYTTTSEWWQWSEVGNDKLVVRCFVWHSLSGVFTNKDLHIVCDKIPPAQFLFSLPLYITMEMSSCPPNTSGLNDGYYKNCSCTWRLQFLTLYSFVRVPLLYSHGCAN